MDYQCEYMDNYAKVVANFLQFYHNIYFFTAIKRKEKSDSNEV